MPRRSPFRIAYHDRAEANNIERVLETALAQSEELSSLLRTALEQPNGENAQALREELRRREEEQKLLRSISGNPKGEAAD